MNDLLPIAMVLILYVGLQIIVALIGKKLTKNLSQYILANRSLSAPITALGAGASDMSSWLTMALPGVVYLHGLSMIWMPIALLLGAWANWHLVAKRLRIYTELANNSLTLPSYLSHRFADHNKFLRLVTAGSSVIFFIWYAAAGFMSGAILLQIIFNLPYISALVLSSTVIIAYTAIGGFLAVSWIDFFQGSLMFFALLTIPKVTIGSLGGLSATLNLFQQFDPKLLQLLPAAGLMDLVACAAWGLGYFGQPHINVRFMAISSTQELPLARRICMSWMFLSLAGAVATGILGVAFFGQDALPLPETVFIELARKLFTPWIAGIFLAAVLASIMSTVSAQLLITTSIVIKDLCFVVTPKPWQKKWQNNFQSLWFSKVMMIILSLLAVGLACNPKTILHAVGFAWSGLGATFGPTILCSLYWRRMNLPAAIAGVTTGMLTMICMQSFLGAYTLPGLLILPSFGFSLLAIWIFGKFTKAPKIYILEKFDEMLEKASK